MQIRKNLGLALLYSGALIMLFGLIFTFLPTSQNEQIRLIIASFEVPSNSPVLDFINQQFLSMIRYHNQLLMVGGGAIFLGLILFLTARISDAAVSQKRRPASPPVHRSSTLEWRRPAAFPPPYLNHSWENTLLDEDFAPLSTPSEPPKSVPVFDPREDNPYFAYGQSAYAPPKRNEILSPNPAPDLSFYQRPIASDDFRAESPSHYTESPQADPISQTLPEKPSPLASAFQKPALADTAALGLSLGELPEESTVHMRPSSSVYSSAHSTNAKSGMLHAASALDITEMPIATTSRIRSTMRKKTP